SPRPSITRRVNTVKRYHEDPARGGVEARPGEIDHRRTPERPVAVQESLSQYTPSVRVAAFLGLFLDSLGATAYIHSFVTQRAPLAAAMAFVACLAAVPRSSAATFYVDAFNLCPGAGLSDD